MANPIRLLAIGDAGVRTGWERVLRGTLDHLNATGKYDITVRGMGYGSDSTIDYDYPVYPVHGFFGIEHLPEYIKLHKPDAVWMVQDLHNLHQYLVYKPVEVPFVGYFPVDAPNIRWQTALAAGAMSEPVTYTQFGAREAAAAVQAAVDIMAEGAAHQRLDPAAKRTSFSMPTFAPHLKQFLHVRMDRLARLQNPDAWNVVPHGLDLSQFKVLDKAECRRAFGLPEDAFIVGCVQANQFRKRLDLTIRAFARFVHRHAPDALLVIHSAGGQREGWDLPQLARLYGVERNVVPVYDHLQPPFFELSEDELCVLYNCFDVHLNNGGGEGWGLTSFETAACGVPQIVPDWSATRELWQNAASLLPVHDIQCFYKGTNTAHAVIDPDAIANALCWYRDPDFRAEGGRFALANAQRQVGWDQVGDAFDRIIRRALHESPPVPYTVAEMLAERKARVQSEAARF